MPGVAVCDDEAAMTNVEFHYFCGHEQFQPEVLVDHAVLAEKAGFDGVFVSEHFHPWVDDVGAAGYAFSTLAAMAQATERVRLITGVIAPIFRHHPAIVAQAAATIDRISGGRFELGIGTGENINEGPLGFSFGNFSERIGRIREAIHIIRALFAGEKITFEGSYYSTESARLYSPPLHQIPIWMAAGRPRSSRNAARHADGIITSVKDPADTLRLVVTPANAAAAEVGRPPPVIIATRWCAYAGDEDEAWEALRPWRGLRVEGRLSAVDPAVLRRRADAMSRQEIIGMFQVAASPDELVDRYAPLITDLDAKAVVMQITSTNQPDTIRMLGEEVLPRLRALAAEKA